jgi:hypothetical protein
MSFRTRSNFCGPQVDPFFSKNGAGTFLRIKVDGTADDPNFGLDRGKKD